MPINLDESASEFNHCGSLLCANATKWPGLCLFLIDDVIGRDQ